MVLKFSWIFPIIIKGSKRLLKEEDLYETSKYHTSEYLGDLLQNEWSKELKRTNPSILKALLRFVGWKYLIIILLAIIKAIRLNPFCLEKSNVGQMVNLLANDVSKFHNAIRLNPFCLEKSNVGQMVNLLANDVSKFHNLIFAPIVIPNWVDEQAIRMTTYYREKDCHLSKYAKKVDGLSNQSEAASLGDKRLNLLNEMITAMRLIKMYTWELAYTKLIEKIRIKEMKKVELFLYTRGISVILAYPVSKLFISLTFLAFFLNGGQLNAEIVFVTMSFSVFIFTSTFNLFSQAMNLVAEILVSLKRIQIYLKISNIVEISSDE
ncbi:multidrug resistance-associated protein 4-like [Centruroides sculpturatus]|uniref:multidrug resistance-associated protein 4-like n=1 Tax=Centruroides sculpturatus TaxID=218467 RepID=UPI000C6DC015|nr:multidrug resistance-associated protein 4-like [Centruroides sculpturatus]